MKLKKSTAYMVTAICAGIYFTFAEAGKPSGEPFSLAMLFLGFWMLGSSYESADTMEQLSGISAAQDRIFDMLHGDDGQADKEARRYLERTRPDLIERLRTERKT